jgi:hypothetical protein
MYWDRDAPCGRMEGWRREENWLCDEKPDLRMEE